jgi:hypothetical protein
MHILLVAARAERAGREQIDAIIDRSDQNGFGPTKAKLAPGTLEVLGPGRLDLRSDGSRAALASDAEFRLIADSDQGPFRDLLMLPDLFGHILIRQYDLQSLMGTLSSTPFFLLNFDLARAKAALASET